MITWALLRSTGVIALALLSLSVVLGIAGPAIRQPRARLVSVSLHRTSAVVGTVLLAGHVVLAVVDSWVPVSPLAAVIPGISQVAIAAPAQLNSISMPMPTDFRATMDASQARCGSFSRRYSLA